MVERLYLQELVSFAKVELNFNSGLVVLSGPSGAGKSVLMSALLSSFGYSTQGVASICEVDIKKPLNLKNDVYMLEDTFSIKTLKKDKLRYFLNGQNISKKTLNEIFKPYVKYLSVRDKDGFGSQDILDMIDTQLTQRDKTFKKLYKEYKKRYKEYKEKNLELLKIKEEEKTLIERVEYIKYEIEKIEKINPKVEEEESLLQIKQQLSRVDKIKDALDKAMNIFSLESTVEEVYRLLDKDISSFSDVMNQLRSDFEESQKLANELEEVDIEEVLNRLSDLNTLKNRYGNIEEALAYKAEKEKELLDYENIEQDKSILELFLSLEYSELVILAGKISYKRKEEAKLLEYALKKYLHTLKLPALVFEFSNIKMENMGTDSVDILLGTSKTITLSGGEFNRLRLALMAATINKNTKEQGVLILDEIDANVSGDESIAIAQMIVELSAVYQIFAISHQAHLSAQANQHLLIKKEGDYSQVIELSDISRIQEITRIIAGEKPTKEAMEFAKKLRATV